MGQVVAFLDKYYPDTAPGSPDPQQPMDQNKKGSRVIAKSGAQKRIDSALGGKRPDARGRMVLVDREIARSYGVLRYLFEAVPRTLSTDHHLAARYVLLNVNTAGGHEELLRVKEIGRGRDGDPDAKEVVRLCDEVIGVVLSELDRREYWLGWGTDAQEAERQAAAADRRKRGGVLATAEGRTGREVIAEYRELMVKTGSTATEAEELTAGHFGCSPLKVRKAVAKMKAMERSAS